MKYLVVLTSLLAATARATPITPGYGVPAAPVVPIQTVDIAVPAPPVVAPAGVVEVRRSIAPVGVATRSFVRNIAASPVPLPLARSAPLVAPTPLAPSPFARAFPAAPVIPRALPAVAAPLALSPLPLAGAPLARSALPLAGAPLAPAPLPLAAGAPVAPAPLPLAAGAPVAPAPLPLAAGAPLPLVRSPVAALSPVPLAAAPAVANTQFHAQDELGGFNFGYQNAESGRQEVRTPDGVTRGSYSYVDANGIPQTVNYVADPVNGFRVQATNLPVAPAVAGPVAVANAALPAVVVDTPEVAAAKADFQLAFDAAVAQAEAEAAAEIAEEVVALPVVARKKRSPITPGYGIPAAPVVVAEPTPVVVATPPVQVGVIETRRVLPVAPAPVLPAAVRAAAPILPVPAVRAAAPILPAAALPAAPLPAAIPAVRAASPLGLTPVGPAPVIPGPVRTIPLAATAQVRTPLTAIVADGATSQFHAQDELGGATFGYQGPTSGRQETRTADGVVRGAYSYVDGNGVVQTVEYIADALGFRVAATNLPVAPVA